MKKFRAASMLVFFFAWLIGAASETSAASRLSVLHSFGGPTTDGSFPEAAVMRAADGNFYGTTRDGGTFDRGTIFRMTPSGQITVLYNFAGGNDGNGPMAPLIQASDGNFYGTTQFGGGVSLGTVFRMTPAGVVTIIHPFLSAADGANPRAALLQGSDGHLYGTTEQGGGNNRGTLFGMTLAGATFVRYSFTGGADGANPYAPVMQASNGAIYGTVYAGTLATHGRIFRLTGTTITVVHTFQRTATDGADPLATLVEGRDGNFYGTTRFGGAFDGGTVFKLTPGGAFAVIKSFSAAEGAPDTSLMLGRDGNFYGTTSIGGVSGRGTVYKITPTGFTTILHSFSGGADGATPSGHLVQGPGQILYGTTTDGGAGGKGVVFRIAVGASPADFDVDGSADLAIFRPSNGRWFTQNLSTGAFTSRQWGVSGDSPVSGDFDGDGLNDFAVFRPSTGHWLILKSTSGFAAYDDVDWGDPGDVPVPGDYDGDGKTDISIFRPSNGQWYIIKSATSTIDNRVWGASGDVPVTADYDGDGKADMAVYRPSTGEWFVLRSSNGTGVIFSWGLGSDVPVPGDYDGDGRADIAIYRPSARTWYILKSTTNFSTYAGFNWGVAGDVPVPADYDGDGASDVAIYRPSSGHWFVLKSSTGFTTYDARQWGVSTDIPILLRD